MLRDIYLEFGTPGMLVIATLLVATVLSWFMALAGVVVSSLPKFLKVILVLVLSAVPPVSILVLGFFLFESSLRRGLQRRSVQLCPAETGVPMCSRPVIAHRRTLLKPAPVYSEVA